MKFIFLIFFNLLPVLCFAETPLILGPAADREEYLLFLKQHPSYISWAKYQHKKLSSNEQQEQTLFKSADLFPKDPHTALRMIREEEDKNPLSILSTEFLFDLSDKLRQKNHSQEINEELKRIYCKTNGLLGRTNDLSLCTSSSTSANRIEDSEDIESLVLVEAVPIGDVSSALDTSQVYHWTILSDRKRPVGFRGSYKDLKNHNIETTFMVSGSCDDFTLSEDDKSSSYIFFSPNCIRHKDLGRRKASWISQHNPWLASVAIVSTLAALIYLSDKTLKVTVPF